MARLPRAAPYTPWILLLSYTTNAVVTAGHVQEFACFTDYDKELVCHWEVPAPTNCSKEFLLYYSKETSSVLNMCVPENEKDSLRCTCTIYPDYFVSGLTYILALQFNGTDMWNFNVTPALVVKPRAPKNLAIEQAENGNFNLSWEESHSHSSLLSGQPVIYEVKYWRKQHPTEVSVKAINYQAKSFEITASSLKRGYDYVASLRCNYMDFPAYWSEWSEEVEFHYDYQVKAEDILQMAVPTSCILIMAGSVICYFCFSKVKKEWWDQIPNPAKSHLVAKNVKFSVSCHFDEIKFPFHDLKQSHLEQQISCKNCLAQSLSSQNFKGKDNIRNVEKSCSCHSQSGEWLPKGSSAVLTPDAIPVEECVEICVCLTDSETESQEETGSQVSVFEPCEGSTGAFREHNELLANMFDALLADENNMQDNKGPNILTAEKKTLKNIGSENPSQQNPKESPAQSLQPCDISHTAPLFTRASKDDYNCSTASKESELSEESFESGYQSSSINSASLDARDLQQMVHQSLFLCGSESELDSCVLIQDSTDKSLSRTKTDRMNSPADKSFDSFVSESVGLCSSGYKSCDTLLSPCPEPCGSAYRSFSVLVSAGREPSSSAYRSFSALVSQPVAGRGLALAFAGEPSSLPLTGAPETPECSCTGYSAHPASSCTAHSAQPASSCTAHSAQPECSCTAHSAQPASSCTAHSAQPASSCTAHSAQPASSCTAHSAHPASSCTAHSAQPASSCTAHSAQPASSCTAHSAQPECSCTAHSAQPASSCTAHSAQPECSCTAHSAQPASSCTAHSAQPASSCTAHSAHPASSPLCPSSCRSPSAQPGIPNTCAEHTDVLSFSTPANEGAAAFLSEEETHKPVTYQNVQRKANTIPCPIAPQPPGYQPFGSAGKQSSLYWDSDSEVLSSLDESFTHLCNNLSEAPADTALCEAGLRVGLCRALPASLSQV